MEMLTKQRISVVPFEWDPLPYLFTYICDQFTFKEKVKRKHILIVHALTLEVYSFVST